MLKTLLKKQFAALLAGLSGGKPGKSVKFYVLVIGGSTLLMGAMFYFLMDMLCAPLVAIGADWLYFVYACLLAMIMAIIGGVFMAQSQLYEAKDNDLMLSLPVPPRYILFTRMVSLYAQNFLFQAAALIPACIVYGITAPVTAVQALLWIVMLFVQPFFSLFITCLLGFLLALITSRLRDKTLVTMILSIAFIVLYFIAYTNLMDYVNTLILHSAVIGSGIKGNFYPLYALGSAFTANGVGFIITLAIVGGLFGGLYALLSFTYIKLVTSKHGGARAKYKGRPDKAGTQFGALFKKEAKRFFGSGIYFLNCGLGVVMLFIVTIYFMIKGATAFSVFSAVPGMMQAMPLIVCVFMALICFMDMVSAPSVSLEGKNLWILQSSPVSMKKVLLAKLVMHYVVTAPAATLCTIVFIIKLAPSPAMIIMMLLAPSVVVTLSGALGLVYNLKKPNLNWDNETFVIKQSMSVLLTMLTGWGILAALAGLYFAARLVMPDSIYLMLCLMILSGITAWFITILLGKGARKMEYLA